MWSTFMGFKEMVGDWLTELDIKFQTQSPDVWCGCITKETVYRLQKKEEKQETHADHQSGHYATYIVF